MGDAVGGGVRGRVGEGGALMMTTRSLDLDLELLLLLLVVLGNKAPMTRLDKGLLFCLALGVATSSMTSTIGADAGERGVVLIWEIMNSEVGSPYCMNRMGCSLTT